MEEFKSFGKIPRLSRPIVITEKLDGTNAQIIIDSDGNIMAGSRRRYITPEDDNFGFAAWVEENKDDLLTLGPGRHFGEWWGQGIGRGYDLDHKRFSLFNTSRWGEERPECCYVVPVIAQSATLNTPAVKAAIEILTTEGSRAAPGFMDPEGIVIFHTQSNLLFKKTIKNDELPKYLADRGLMDG